MNENPGETPNPLNPNPAGPAPAPNPTPMPEPTPAPANTAASAPVTTVKVDSLAPDNRPMEKVALVEAVPEKKKKAGLIAGIIAAIVVLLIGGIVAAVVLINANKVDTVTAAMNKIMSGNAPANVAIDGNIDITINDEFSPISHVKVALNSGLMTNSFANSSKAEVTATVRNVGDLKIKFDEVYAGNGDLYFKIDGLNDALEKSGLLYLLNLSGQLPGEVDCGEDGYCQTTELQEIVCDAGEECESLKIDDTKLNVLGEGAQNVLNEDSISYFSSLLGIVKIDGEWLRVSVDELNMLSDETTADSDISCITNLVSDINTNSNSAAELYSKYPFITSSNKDIKIASRQHPVYQVSIDSENFANYVNSIQNAELTTNLYSCLKLENNVQVSADDVTEIVSTWPEIYAEVDDNNNFTRLYLTSNLNDGEGSMVIDLGFSYPTNVNVPEPMEYKDFSEAIQEILSSMYSLPIDN